MTDNTKDKVTGALKAGAEAGKVAAEATKGKPWPKWLRWAVIIGAALAAAVGAWTQTGCAQVQRVTPAQVQQAGQVVRAAHGGYHALTGKPCVFKVEEEGK